MEIGGTAGAGPLARHAFLVRWVGWVSLGESLGFLAPVLAEYIGATAWPGGGSALLIAAGLAEGAVLGWFQVRLLQTRLPAVAPGRWVLLTAVAAGFAWSVGLLPSAFPAWQEWPAPAVGAAGSVGAVLLLGSIGSGQWIELRHHVPRAWRWIAGTAAAWAAGLAAFMAVATPLWEPGQAAWLTAIIGVGAAVLMAVAMATVSGLVLVRLLRELPPEPRAAGRSR
ncbi:hypothetical protein [Arthrobacter sp. C152]